MAEWIGVDLDGTLTYWYGWVDPMTIGAPVPSMVKFVKELLAAGKDVRIFTARVAASGKYSEKGNIWDDQKFADQQRILIQDWTERWIGVRLSVTATKDFEMVRCYDDRAIQVLRNAGTFVDIAEQS